MKAIFKEWHGAPPLDIAQAALDLHQAADRIAATRARLGTAGQVLPRVLKQWKVEEQRVRDLASSFYDGFLTAAVRRFGFHLSQSVPLLDTTQQAAYAVAWVLAQAAAAPPSSER